MTNTTHLKGPIIYTFYGYLSVQLSNFSIHCKTTRPSGTSCKINRRLKCKSSSTYIVLKVVLQICLYRILYSFHFKLFCKEGTMILKIITINCHNYVIDQHKTAIFCYYWNSKLNSSDMPSYKTDGGEGRGGHSVMTNKWWWE